MKLAADIILAFSDRPLKFAIFLGAFIFSISVLLTIYFIFIEINFGFSVQGWPSLVVLITFFGGILLFMLGVLGIYIGQIFEEVKKRPLFIIDQEINNS